LSLQAGQSKASIVDERAQVVVAEIFAIASSKLARGMVKSVLSNVPRRPLVKATLAQMLGLQLSASSEAGLALTDPTKPPGRSAAGRFDLISGFVVHCLVFDDRNVHWSSKRFIRIERAPRS